MAVSDALLIIGNGYDLASGLKSSFSDYFKETYMKNGFYPEFRSVIQRVSTSGEYYAFYSKYSTTEFFINLTIWDIYFMIATAKSEDFETWTDVETAIHDSLNIRDEKGQVIHDTFWLKSVKYLKDTLGKSTDKIIVHNHEILATFMKFIQSKVDYVNIFSILNPYNYLLAELQEFELFFTSYIAKMANDVDYINSAASLLKRINDLNIDRRIVSVLNFNYTRPFVKDFPGIGNLKIENVHGLITKDQRDTIIGIDSSKIQYEDPGYIFTKTSRKLESNIFNNRKISERILDKKINHIIFYGHSLGKQDYAYFQSIFDYYDLYHNDITLEFIYSYHDGKSTYDIEEDQLTKVTKLMETYGNSHMNTHQGKNLLHKMLIEGRIFVIRV